mmetsp:Transcript_10435/g.30737  ORF Transcript_10435/g.30737 Transcript_10435/m.30737 type:complete len:205 (+) Transcript_10435:2229-2843(+)
MKAFTVVDTWSGSRVSGSAVCTTWSIRERRFCSEVSPGCSSSGGVNTVAHSSRSCFSTRYRAWSLNNPLAVVTRIKSWSQAPPARLYAINASDGSSFSQYFPSTAGSYHWSFVKNDTGSLLSVTYILPIALCVPTSWLPVAILASSHGCNNLSRFLRSTCSTSSSTGHACPTELSNPRTKSSFASRSRSLPTTNGVFWGLTLLQ